MNSNNTLSTDKTVRRRDILTRAASGLAVLGIAAALGGCAVASAEQATPVEGDAVVSATATEDAAGTEAAESTDVAGVAAGTIPTTDDMFTKRDLAGTYEAAEAVSVVLDGSTASATGANAASGVVVDGSTVTITDEGVYVFSGSLENGRIVVAAEDTDKVQIVLDGVSLASDTGCVLYVQSADKAFVTLAEGSQNTFAATGTYGVDPTNETTVDACVFSKSDLTFNGTGALTVTSSDEHGVVSKDDLVFADGTYQVNAAGHALSGKDSVRIAAGTFDLTAGKNALDSDNDDDTTRGYIYVSGGTMNLNSQNDAVHASSNVYVTAGTITINAVDDGIHADNDVHIAGGAVWVASSYEGIEGLNIYIEGGDTSVNASDDGLNATNGGGAMDGMGGMGGMGGGRGAMMAEGEMPAEGEVPVDFGAMPTEGEMPAEGEVPADLGAMPTEDETPADAGAAPTATASATSSTPSIVISGGTLLVDANGDGLDSNGSILVTGGTTFVYGPESSADGALDYDTNATITGGTLVAVGSMGMAQGMGTDSTQGAALVTLNEGTATGDLVLTDADGNVLVSCSPTKSYNSVLVSCPEMVEGATYTLQTGGTTTSVEMTSLVIGSSGMGGMGGMGGMRMDGMGGGRGAMMGEAPTDAPAVPTDTVSA